MKLNPNSSVQFETTTPAVRNSFSGCPLRCGSFLVALALASFTLLPSGQATQPPKGEDRGNGNSAAENVQALNLSATGGNNTAHGWFSLFSNTTGDNNTATGYRALYWNIAGHNNTADGVGALENNTTDDNTAVGWHALVNSTGMGNLFHGENSAVGSEALASNTSGAANTAIGFEALFQNTTGRGNIALGWGAGSTVITGFGNIHIGSAGLGDESQTIRIGSAQTTAFMAGIYNATVPSDVPVLVDSDGHLGTITSSARFKDEIKPMGKTSEAILALKPVTFRYKKHLDPRGIAQFGLVAEEVEKVNPDLVVRDQDGKPYTVRYGAVNAMLLNEFLKQHRKLQEQEAVIAKVNFNAAKQEATIALQQQEIKALTTTLKQHAAQIQKVSAQLAITKPAPRVVLSSP